MYRVTIYMLVVVVALYACHVTCESMDYKKDSHEMPGEALGKRHLKYNEYQQHEDVKRQGGCSNGAFACNDGSCVDIDLLCDGNDDCVDGEDEVCNCVFERDTQRPAVGGVGGIKNQIRDSPEECCQFCVNTAGCIQWTWQESTHKCFLKSVVNDKEEKIGAISGLLPSCHVSQFKCNDDNECIRPEYVCDGDLTCPDGEDEDNCPPGTVKQDPHVMTFDGLKYNFNGYCSYTLVKSCDDVIYPPFEITADFRGRDPSLPYEPPTFMVAFNITSNGKQVIRINEDDVVMIKGKPMTSTSAVIGDDEGDVEQNDNRILVYLKEPALSLTWRRRIHGIEIGLNDIKLRGKVCGLLGNDDGNPHNEFIKPDGERTFNADEFGYSWLIPGSCP